MMNHQIHDVVLSIMWSKSLIIPLKYSNHRGIFRCSCGFERPKPDMMLTELSKDFDEWTVKIEGNVLQLPHR